MDFPEITIQVKIKKKPDYQPFTVKSSRDIFDACKYIFDMDMIAWREEAIIIGLNKKNQVVGFFKLSSGGIDATILDSRMIYTVALNCCASAIIVAHNHPSGTLRPSQADMDITKKVKNWGDVLNIPLIDHLIVTEDGYFSFLDDGLI